jgi:pyridoxal phosphate enzyme (YggS family)
VSEPKHSEPAAGRRAELTAGVAAVEDRIAAACQAAGRPRSDVHLVVVTKTFPASDVRLLAGLGVTDVGESRDQEAAPKAAACSDLALRWHFVGRLQSNKARSVASYASVVHSVDRTGLVGPLSAGATRAGRTVAALAQVSLDGDPKRGGAVDTALPDLCARIAAAEGLVLYGVMAVAPLGLDPAVAFERLRGIADSVRRDHPDATWVSAGMSGDLEAAVAAGATHLRVGSAILGSRPPLR